MKGYNENVEWMLCNMKFCISFGDDMTSLNTQKWNKNTNLPFKYKLQAVVLSWIYVKVMVNKWKGTCLEVMFAYHMTVYDHSFKFTDCTTAVLKQFFDNKFICSQINCTRNTNEHNCIIYITTSTPGIERIQISIGVNQFV